MSSCREALDDDLNTALVLASLAEWTRRINSVKAGTESLTELDLAALRKDFGTVVNNILGLADEGAQAAGNGTDLSSELINLLLRLRLQAKASKDFATSDKIRNELSALGVTVKDTKDGFEWTKE
jgi:cysteinyl-tRNA synthetase